MSLLEFEYREWFELIDKSTWAKGEWHKEPDRVQWLHEASGYPCMIRRAYVSGSWCGYVGVSKSSKVYELGCNDIQDGINVHGGLTFADFGYQTKKKYDGIYIVCLFSEGDEDSEKLWWLGFDCGHTWDITPALAATLRGIGYNPILCSEEVKYRTQEYIVAGTNSLAEQLMLLENIKKGEEQ